MSALSDAPDMRTKRAYNKIQKSAPSEESYDLSEISIVDALHGGSWRVVGTSNPIVEGIEESNEELALSLQPTPQQFEDEWVARGDAYMGVFKCFSYSHNSYVS
jgi:hypothetical protein